jgi:hypothetical protein
MARHGEEEGRHAATHLTPVSQTRLWAGRIMHAHLPEGEQMDVSPHVRRHTFLRQRAETTGVHEAREASRHPSDRSLWWSVKPDQQTMADAMDALE